MRDHAWAVVVALAVSAVIIAVTSLIGLALEALFGWPHPRIAVVCSMPLALVAGWYLEETVRIVAHVRRRMMRRR